MRLLQTSFCSQPIIWLIATIYLAIWFGLGATRLWDRDEPRNARCAVEMLERNDWIVPTFNGELRTHKPILLYWLQMPSIGLFGKTDFAARLGSALMASITALGTFYFGKRTLGQEAGFWASAALSTSLMFVVAARAATPDACLIATTSLAIYSLVLEWLQPHPRPSRWFFVGYFCLGLAILAKGPVGLVLPCMILPIWGFMQLWKAEPQYATLSSRIGGICSVAWRTLSKLRLIPGLGLALAVAIPWYVWVGLRTDGEWLRGFFIDHNLGRAVTAMEGHQGGIWFYPVASLVGLFPWSMLLIPILYWIGRHWRHSPQANIVQLGIVWLGTYICLFSVAQTKLPSYITPGYPGAALLIGGFLADWRSRRIELSSRWLVIGAVAFALIGGSIGSVICYASFDLILPKLAIHSLWPMGFVVVAVLFGYLATRRPSQRVHGEQRIDQSWCPRAVLLASTIFVLGLFGMASPIVSDYRRDLDAIVSENELAKPIVAGAPQPVLWCAARTIEPSWVYYTGTTIQEFPDIELQSDRELNVDETSSPLKKIAHCLRNPHSRFIVNADNAKLWQEKLRQEFAIETACLSEFSTFLKEERIAILHATSSSQR